MSGIIVGRIDMQSGIWSDSPICSRPIPTALLHVILQAAFGVPAARMMGVIVNAHVRPAFPIAVAGEIQALIA